MISKADKQREHGSKSYVFTIWRAALVPLFSSLTHAFYNECLSHLRGTTCKRQLAKEKLNTAKKPSSCLEL